MRKFEGIRRLMSFLLTFCMVLSYVPMLAMAESECIHHEHGDDCGYREETLCGFNHETGCRYDMVVIRCAHTHGEGDCTYVEAREAVSCHPTHDETCGYAPGVDCTCGAEEGTEHAEDCAYEEAVPCNVTHEGCICAEAIPESGVCGHVCSAEAGCEMTENHICVHLTHDEACGYQEQKACTFDCLECKAEQEAAEKVKSVQALVDALPETVTEQTKDAVGEQLNAVIRACQELEEGLQAQVDLSRYEATLAAMYALENQPDAQKPQMLAGSPPAYGYFSAMDSLSCTLTPGKTGEDFYNFVANAIHTKTNYKLYDKDTETYSYHTYITRNRVSGYQVPSGGFFWADCKPQTFESGKTYYVYAYCHGINVDAVIVHQYPVHVNVAYTISTKVSGAPAGYGGITVNGNNVGGSYTVAPGGSVTFTVKEVPGHKATVTYGTASCTVDGNNYTFNNVNQNFTFSVVYEADQFATVSFTQPEGATIKVNNDANSPVKVVSGLPYTVTVTADTGYQLKEIKLDDVSQNITNKRSMTITSTAGAEGVAHTVSVTTEKVNLQVKETASLVYGKEEDAAGLIKKIFNTVYAGSEYGPNDVNIYVADNKPLTLLIDGMEADIDGWSRKNYEWLRLTESVGFLSYEFKESVKVSLRSGDVTSAECTLYLYDGDIQAKAGGIQKDCTGSPVSVSNSDFTFNLSYLTSPYIAEKRYYDETGNLLSAAPTEPGKYQVRVKAVAATPSSIVSSRYSSWSNYIPFEIVQPTVKSITGITGNKTYDSKPAQLSYTVTTQGVGEQTWQVTDGQCEGFPFTPEYAYKKDGASDFTTGLPTEVGTYTVKVTIGEKSAEGTVTIFLMDPPALSELEISGATYVADNGVNWFQTGTSAIVKPPVGYTISKVLDGTYGMDITLAQADSLKVYLKREDGALSGAINLSDILKWDTTAPTGTVKVGEKTWDDLQENISFLVFSKEAQTAAITAMDTDSGVKFIEYYVSEESLSKEELAQKQWTTGSSVELSLPGKSIVYARITDNVGNETYLSSDGIVIFRDSAADISEVSYTYKANADRSVPIHLYGNTVESVTLDGKDLVNGTDYTLSVSADDSEGEILLKGSSLDTLDAGEYDLSVSFNPLGETLVLEPGVSIAELSFKVTVARRELTLISVTAIDRTYEKGNREVEITVVESECAAGDEVTIVAKGILASDAAGDYQKVTLSDVVVSGADAANYVLTDKREVDTDVTISPKSLNHEDITLALADQVIFSGNPVVIAKDGTTVLEKNKDFTVKQAGTEGECILTITGKGNYKDEASTKLTCLVVNLPAPEDVEPDDKTAIDAYDTYSKLNETYKDEELKKALEELHDALTDYEVIKGHKSNYVKGSYKKLSFTANGYYGKFTGVEVDGKLIDAKYYTAESGSTIITLRSSYLETLKTGKHYIQVNYTDGSTDGRDYFRITVNNGSPFTGDDSHMMLVGGIAITSLLCMAGMLLLLSRKKGRYER